ncbi:MAG: dihydroneopterin aldolase, partial [Nitrososphaeraceae archaeon]
YLQTSVFIDYSQITGIITTNITESKYELIEEALIGLKDILILEFPNILSLYIKLVKPHILSNCTVGVSELWNF